MPVLRLFARGGGSGTADLRRAVGGRGLFHRGGRRLTGLGFVPVPVAVLYEVVRSGGNRWAPQTLFGVDESVRPQTCTFTGHLGRMT